jgi:pyruvate dehydrogenase phosphatase
MRALQRLRRPILCTLTAYSVHRQTLCTARPTAQHAACGATYPANNPIEDRYVIFSDPEKTLRLAAVLDGHGGWQVADFVSKNLVNALTARKCLDMNAKDEMDTTMRLRLVYNDLEEAYINSVRSAYKLGYGNVASVGACTLVAIVKDSNLVVANAGDCRCVLGIQKASGYEAMRITTDHNCRYPSEQEKLRRAHPGENDIVLCHQDNPTACYVKGKLQLTRAIGDLYLKHHEFNAPSGLDRSAGRHIRQ